MTIKRTRYTNRGYTLIELLIVIAIIGILTAIGIVSFSSVQSQSRNSQRLSKITVISEALEKYYDKNGAYPSCAEITAASNTVSSTTLNGLDPSVLTTPSGAKGTNSFTSCTTDPISDTFAYILNSNGSYTLKYKEEGVSSSVKSVASRRSSTDIMYTLTLTAGTGGTVSSGGSYAANTAPIITATANAATGYTFDSWTGSAGCFGISSHTITMDASKSCTATFTAGAVAAPAAPTVVIASQPTSSTTRWSWTPTPPAWTCQTGSTIRYTYQMTTTSPTTSGTWSSTVTATTADYGTGTEGTYYTLNVKAECFNATTNMTSGWSTIGSSPPYYRAIPQCTLGLTAVGGGTVSKSPDTATYNCGLTIKATPTITASPAANYDFSTWTGTDCGTTSSHIVTMTANMDCKASFTPTAIGQPAALTVTAVTSGDTTTWTRSNGVCGANTAFYQYKYTIDTTVISDWTDYQTATAPQTTPSEGHTYIMAFKVRCYNAAATSAYSTEGSKDYFRQFSLAISADTGGTVNTAVNGSYATNSTVTITATASAGYRFGSWVNITGTTGATACTGADSHVITIDGTKKCQAKFIKTYTLVVSVVGTGGTVNTAVNGTYDTGATPTITATKAANYDFSTWTGTDCGTTSSHIVTMTANMDCKASFTATTYTLTLTASPVAGGSVSKTGTSPYASGSTPTITATANSGYVFSSWTGTNCSGVASHPVPAMAANMSCTANFTAGKTLTLKSSGGGTIYTGDGYINTTTSGSHVYLTGTVVALFYNVASGSGFGGWQGAGCFPWGQYYINQQITLNADMTCTAYSAYIPPQP